MAKSESATQEWTLASVPAGDVVEVLEVAGGDPDSLVVHGIRPGVRVVVESDAPFGGPRIVRLGGCRIAIDRRLTQTVRVGRVVPPASNAGPLDRR